MTYRGVFATLLLFAAATACEPMHIQFTLQLIFRDMYITRYDIACLIFFVSRCLFFAFPMATFRNVSSSSCCYVNCIML